MSQPNPSLDAVRALTEAWRARAAAHVRLTSARAVCEGDPLDDVEVATAAQALFEARRHVEVAELACYAVADAP